MRLGAWSLACYRLPYEREVRWADGLEDGGLFALHRLVRTRRAAGSSPAAPQTWLPFIHTYRTLCLAPPPEVKAVFQGLGHLALAS